MAAMEPSGLGWWFEHEARALVLYASQWLDRAVAEDVVQDVFVRLMAENPPPANPKAWLYRSVRNGAFKQWRGRRRREAREAGFVGNDASFVDQTDRLMDARQAERALSSLPDDEREIVTLRIWGGLTLEEAAAIVEVSTPTAFRKYRAALDRLRKTMNVLCPSKTH